MGKQWVECDGFKQVLGRVDERREDGTFAMDDEEARRNVAMLEDHARGCLRCTLRMEMLDPDRRVLASR